MGGAARGKWSKAEPQAERPGAVAGWWGHRGLLLCWLPFEGELPTCPGQPGGGGPAGVWHELLRQEGCREQ